MVIIDNGEVMGLKIQLQAWLNCVSVGKDVGEMEVVMKEERSGEMSKENGLGKG